MSYSFQPTATSPEKLKEYSVLLSTVFPESKRFTPEFLNWQYVQNPNGKVVGFDAYLNNELAAHYVTIPVLYAIHGKPTMGLLSLNTATHPNHQGKGLFTQLANKTYELAQELGYEFVIGVANANSTPGFLNKLGFRLVGQLEAKLGIGTIKPGNAAYLLKSIWTHESREWRIKNPDKQYYIANNIIFTDTDKPLIYAIMGQSQNVGESPKRIMPLKVWIGLDAGKTINGLFVNIPEKLKPSPLNLIFKRLNPAISSFQLKDVYFELIDFDAY